MEDKVHVWIYHWCTDEEEGSEVMGIYRDLDKASREMRAFMASQRQALEDDDYRFDDDCEYDDDDFICFGFYGTGFVGDNYWSSRIKTVEVK